MTKEELASMTVEEIEERLKEAINRGHMNFLSQLSTPSDASLIVYAEELKLRDNGVISDHLIKIRDICYAVTSPNVTNIMGITVWI